MAEDLFVILSVTFGFCLIFTVLVFWGYKVRDEMEDARESKKLGIAVVEYVFRVSETQKNFESRKNIKNSS